MRPTELPSVAHLRKDGGSRNFVWNIFQYTFWEEFISMVETLLGNNIKFDVADILFGRGSWM